MSLEFWTSHIQYFCKLSVWCFIQKCTVKHFYSHLFAPCAHLLEGPNHPEGVDLGPRRGGLMVSIILLVLCLILILILLDPDHHPPLPPPSPPLGLFFHPKVGKFVFQPMRSGQGVDFPIKTKSCPR